jgi:hypothetical protein
MAIHSKKGWAKHLLYCMGIVNVSRGMRGKIAVDAMLEELRVAHGNS